MTPKQETRTDTETKVVAALAEARKARHHPDCHCRRFHGRWCNAADALWGRAMDRCLSQLQQKEHTDA